MEKILYQSDDFRITLRDTGSDMLVVAFSPMNWPDQHKKNSYWGDAAARKLPFSWLSIDAMVDHWFCDTKWREIVALVCTVTQRFSIRIGYGHSMGGYAALKHSKDYAPQAILAFSPQCSIHPDDVGNFDVRYEKSFNPQFHQAMKVQPSDIDARSFIFFDARFDLDRKHVLRICGNDVSRISVGYVRHDAIFIAKGSISLTYLLMLALRHDAGGAREMQRYLRMQKKKSQIYLAHLAYKAFKNRHAKWAIKIADFALHLDVINNRVALVKLQACMQLNLKDEAKLTIDKLNINSLSNGDIVIVANVLLTLGQKERALQILESSSIEDDVNTKNLRTLANILLNENAVSRAVKLLERAVTLEADDPHCLANLAKGLMRDKNTSTYDLPRAVALLKRAIEIAPEVVVFWKSYAFALEISGDAVGAFSAWLQIEKMTGIESKDRMRFEMLKSMALGVTKR